MHPTDAIALSDVRADAPAGHDLRSRATWDRARGRPRRRPADQSGLSSFTVILMSSAGFTAAKPMSTSIPRTVRSSSK